MVVCSRCDAGNTDDRLFCRECGDRLTVACSTCGQPNQPSDKFCGQCGTPLDITGAAGTGRASGDRRHGSERRQVSVLFVDLVGSTAFAEGRDPEDVRSVLERYFQAARDVVYHHGGTVEKFIGDAVMAVWGTPVAHEDDAERAVRSALEMVDQVAALGHELDVPLQARAGVLTGEALADLDASDMGVVAGDLVNTAARLQDAAEPGGVLVGESTKRATSASISYGPVVSLRVKGKDDPVRAHKALRIVSEMAGANRGSAPEPPFVGRAEQLRLAKELVHLTGREGRPRLLHVTGVAGIGKSRLVWELAKYLDGISEDVFWHAGRCPSYGEAMTFWPLAEMVRARARIADTDDAERGRSRLVECLEDYVSDTDERTWLQPRLGYLLGLEPAPPGDRDELFAAWRRFFERVASRGTVVLLLEDLHWADAALLEFLADLLDRSSSSPILVLTVARSETSDGPLVWGHGVRNSTVVPLDRLTDDDIRSMVTGYVDGIPEDRLDVLAQRAEGVPMYAVETVRMLADRDVLAQKDDRYVVDGVISPELDIPETLYALVAARLDGLPDDERSAVQDASVAGHSFTVDAAAAVGRTTLAECQSRLDALVRKEILDQDLDPRSPERGQYRFRQSMLREVAYSTLTKSARREKHVACARWFEALADDELSGLMAAHYLQAYRADPSAHDAQDLASLARGWLGRASDRSLTMGSPDQAYASAEAALTLADTPAERGRFHHRAAVAAAYRGDSDACWSHCEKAHDDFVAAGDVEGLCDLLTDETVIRFDVARLERRDWLDGLLVELERMLDDHDHRRRANVLTSLADNASRRGRFSDALAFSETALIAAQAANSESSLTRAAGARAYALTNVGRHFEARLLFEESLRRARASGSRTEVAYAALNLGVSIAEDDPAAALAFNLECATEAGLAGDRHLQTRALTNSAEAAVDLGQWDVAESVMSEAKDLVASDPFEESALGFTAAMLAGLRGDLDQADRMLATLQADHGRSWEGAVSMRTWYLRILALTQHLDGKSRQSLETVAEALRLEPAGANSPYVLWTGVQAAGGCGDMVNLRELLDATASLRGSWMSAVRATAEALLSATTTEDDGEPGRDLVERDGTEVLDMWLRLSLPFDHAVATQLLVEVAGASLDDHARNARAFLEELGAYGLLSRWGWVDH